MSGHSHHHGNDFTRAFAIGIALNGAIVVVQFIYGFLANSMALVADGGHNLSDVLGLIVAWAGAVMAKRSPSPRFTYGLKKASILSALVNAFLVLMAVGAIAAESIHHLLRPSAPEPYTMIWVSAAAIIVNILTALLFARGRRSDINVRAAFQHMAADAAVSAAVVVAGVVILWTGERWVDPVMGLVVAAVILWGSIGLLRESVGMSLMGVPSGIEVDEVQFALGQLAGVETVHDLHVWPLSTTETALTAHLVAPGLRSTDELLIKARTILHDRFGIEHCTLQIEDTHLEDAHCR
jgi:cobalt-zinc-cadmium efflux system protein